MNFDPHEPPFMGRLPLSSAFYQASKFNHQKMFLQVNPFDCYVPERYSNRDGSKANAPFESKCPLIPEIKLALNNTRLYTNLSSFPKDNYTAKVAHIEQEACD